MAKQLNDILNSSGLWKGVKKSTVSKLTTGKDPGVDYADKMPDTRDYVAKHSIEKHDDRVGNGPDVYNGAKQTLSTKKEKRHGYNLDSDQKVYEAKDESEYGYEGDMAISQLKSLMRNSSQLISMLKPETDLPEWVQAKITLAEDYITTAANYMMSEMSEATMCEVCGAKNCSCGDMEDEPKKGKGKKGRELLLDLTKKPLKERRMTAADKKDEENLKVKYDDSDMKQNMIKQYGPEKGKQIYFAKIRKMAMETEQAPGDTAIQTPGPGLIGRV
jgi:hypothetical protein